MGLYEVDHQEHMAWEYAMGYHGDPLDHLEEMRASNKSDKTLYIDADSLVYYAAYNKTLTNPCKAEEGDFIGDEIGIRFNDYKQVFRDRVEAVVLECELASYRKELPKFKDYKLIFTPKTNFRYDIYPDYKKSRKNLEKTTTLKRLERYARSLGYTPEGIEADDYVYYMSTQGHPIASGDKDVVYSTPSCYFYHAAHEKVVINTEEDRNKFLLLQCLAGDSTDDIPGIKGVGMKTKLLHKIDKPTFRDVIEIYERKGYTKEDAILTRRLVGLDQFNGRKVKLWNLS